MWPVTIRGMVGTGVRGTLGGDLGDGLFAVVDCCSWVRARYSEITLWMDHLSSRDMRKRGSRKSRYWSHSILITIVLGLLSRGGGRSILLKRRLNLSGSSHLAPWLQSRSASMVILLWCLLHGKTPSCFALGRLLSNRWGLWVLSLACEKSEHY